MAIKTQSSRKVNFLGLQLRGMNNQYLLESLAKRYPHGGGVIELSGRLDDRSPRFITAIHNPHLGSYEETDFDIDLGQPVPNGTIVDITKFQHISPLEVIAFIGFDSGGPLQWVGFVDAWYEKVLFGHLSAFERGADLVAIGKNVGDTYNRYFPAQLYKRIKK